MKINKFLLLILAVNGLFAQQNTTAKIKAVTENGLHKIILPAAIRSYSKEDLSDFRIVDTNGVAIPYYINPETNPEIASHFSEFKVISKTAIPKKKTTVIFESAKTSLDEIVVSITNSDVTKRFNISGSNDQKEWFGLINNSQLNDLENSQDTSVFKTIALPISSYHYLKIDFDDSKTLPINLLKVGFFTQAIKTNAVEEIIAKSSQIGQLSSPNKTQIRVAFDNFQIINQIRFEISNPSLFKRNARIYRIKTRKVKHKVETYQETLFHFELNSNQKNSFAIPQLFEKEFYIEIENQDNQPLSFSKISYFQNQVSVIADLKTTENYTIKTGNSMAIAPNYDLENFKSKISNNLPEATIYEVKHQNRINSKPKEKSIWQQPWFMWVCIGLGGTVILFFTTSLIKDMKKNTSI